MPSPLRNGGWWHSPVQPCRYRCMSQVIGPLGQRCSCCGLGKRCPTCRLPYAIPRNQWDLAALLATEEAPGPIGAVSVEVPPEHRCQLGWARYSPALAALAVFEAAPITRRALICPCSSGIRGGLLHIELSPAMHPSSVLVVPLWSRQGDVG